MYKVVSSFRDAKDNNRLYAVGDEYPATNIKLSKSRIEELANGKTVSAGFSSRKCLTVRKTLAIRQRPILASKQ